MLPEAAIADVEALKAAGFAATWIRTEPWIHSVEVSLDGEVTRLEWVADSDYRFFPTVPDPTFGYVLHPVDLALNKVTAAAGRRALRDMIDLVTIHEKILPLGALVWAVVDKAIGFTPEGLLAEIRRNVFHPRADWELLSATEPMDPARITQALRKAIDEAEAFVAQMPTDKAGLLFLENGRVVQPNPTRLDSYQTHAGCRRGHWPSNSEITSAMLESYA